MIEITNPDGKPIIHLSDDEQSKDIVMIDGKEVPYQVAAEKAAQDIIEKKNKEAK